MLLTCLLFLPGCDSDDVGDSYYTFTGETVGGYISARPEQYSEFQHMLDTTKVMGLLNAYGDYTCFLPTNDALFDFYEHRGKSSLADFSLDSIKIIVYNHLIKDFSIPSGDFSEGSLSNLTMNGRSIEISFQSTDNGVAFIVNKEAKIIDGDIELHNGIIHTIDAVISPTDNTLIEAIRADGNFKLFYEALIETKLYEELELIEDYSYSPPLDLLDKYDGQTNGIGSILRVPHKRKYGFTALLESDATYAANGINNLEDLKGYAKGVYDLVYPEDADITDITDRKNSLNRFVAYHLLNRKIPREFFIEAYDNTGSASGTSHSIKSYDMYEYLETMCPYTLMEVRTHRVSNEYDVFNMVEESGSAVRFVDGRTDNPAVNGVFHEVDGILAYTTDVERMLTSKRIRMDAASFFPEFRNNDIRVGKKYKGSSPAYPSESWKFPAGYIERVETSETTQFGYFNSDDRFLDYQGDEVFLEGLYDFSITTPPIPAGTYEVRFGYQPTGNRGAAQLYWDGQPCGIPLDLRLLASNAKIGYQTPGLDPSDLYGYENDKMMRNRGYMKAPSSFKVIQESWYSGSSARMSPSALRRILGIFTFTKDDNHVFSVRAAREGEFMFDYLEFVPIEVLEFEGVD
ncbi:fasciclin domain-containing protein [Geofilum sp. OHC36d9]|uniref:fasciclin domain-containing protein n=1 Tax=Geofilum sp. OHC36d9 TaxID=3458413 RepID=UPI0040347030